jgi:YidC/Oxa1 family membrane protein insertase
MDKQTTLGFILIGLVLIVWMWLQAPPPRSPQMATRDSAHISSEPVRPPLKAEEAIVPPPAKQLASSSDSLGKFFSHLSAGDEKIAIIKTDLYTAEITTRGGLVRKWELKKYNTWDGHPVHLVDMAKGGDFSFLFNSTDGKLIDTRNLYYRSVLPNWRKIELKDDNTYTLELVLDVAADKRIIKRYIFANGKYSFDAQIEFQNMQTVLSGFEYQVLWQTGLRYAEHNSVDESSFAMAYAYSGGEVAEVDAPHSGESVRKDISGNTSWVATRNKYFAVAILPEQGKSQGAILEGVHHGQPDRGSKEDYSLVLKMPYGAVQRESATFTIFLGPLDFDIVKSYDRDLDKVMSLGAAWLIRPISEYIMIPLLQVLHLVIPNYGFVIIIFSIIIKVVLHPLTKTSMKSMKRMQALQPYMNEIREKYKDDPQKMNQAVMNLYKEYGVNPAAGCLPLLLQMPILFALYSVFRAAIELRQAHFIWWITDLSIPDTIVTLPFAIPLFGITAVSGLALAMGITMFIQQKMTVTDPRQKAMVWMMPVMMTLLFNSFPSGLNLYYFVFNVLSIAQQMWINKHHGEEPLRKVDQKKKSSGLMARLTKDLPKLK